MQIIGSGFGRTGTLSLKVALEELGFGPCYHMTEVIGNPERIETWYDIGRGETPNWSAVFEGYNSGVDFPVSHYYKEIFEVYPEAKIIHTTRDPDRWYDSVRATIYQSHGENSFFPKWLQRSVTWIGQFVAMTDTVIWDGLFDEKFEDRDYAIEIFHARTEEVKQVVPEDKLLIYSVKEGWEPLCTFLDVPVPDTPFPNVNNRESMQRRFQTIRLVTRALPFVAAALILGLLFVILSRRAK